MSSAPAAATAATPFEPRIRIDVVTPRAGPTGSSPIAAVATSRATESRTVTSTPMPLRTSQLRNTCAETAKIVRAIIRLRYASPRMTARPCQKPSRLRSASAVNAEDDGAGNRESDQRSPPRDPERADQGERTDRRECDLDHDDRQLRRDQSARLGRGGRDRSAQLRDSHREPEAAVQQVAEIPDAPPPGRARRRPAVPPAARTQTCQASLRATSQMTCMATAPARTAGEAAPSDSANSSRLS